VPPVPSHHEALQGEAHLFFGSGEWHIHFEAGELYLHLEEAGELSFYRFTSLYNL
jgi:hypothetical protein